MMLLLDTDVFLWLMYNPQKLSKVAHEACQDSNNRLYISIASIWEMQIKHQLGKLELNVSLETCLEEECQINNLQILPIEVKHILALSNVPLRFEEPPFYHKDPFDRILIAQAMVENAHLVSADSVFKNYQVKLLW
ncbi:MAG: PIN domain nuclease [Candidatus Parabeggiatoa sp. nov. 2]|nr:MAG: PIN domain nuclease [Gammaproteobacteria bacterium]